MRFYDINSDHMSPCEIHNLGQSVNKDQPSNSKCTIFKFVESMFKGWLNIYPCDVCEKNWKKENDFQRIDGPKTSIVLFYTIKQDW